MPVDYDALARQAGAIASTPPPGPDAAATPAVDYNALANQAGAVSSVPGPAGFKSSLQWADPIKQARDAHVPEDEILDYVGKFEPQLKDQLAQGIASGKSSTDLLNQLAGLPPDTLGSAAGRYFANLGEQINPVKMLQGLSAAGNHPLEAIKGALDAQAHVGDEAVDSFKNGDYATGVKHALLYLLPLVGPQVDQISNQAAGGDLAGAMGAATGAGFVNSLPDSPFVKALASKTMAVLPKLRNPNTVESAAAQFGIDHDIPVDAATATGNKFVSGAQKLADHSPIGSVVAQKAAHDQAQAFTRVGDELAGRVNAPETGLSPGRMPVLDAAGNPVPGPAVVPTQAGLDTTAEVKKVISARHAEAGKHYTALRAIENDPINQIDVQTGTKEVDTGALDESSAPLTNTVPVIEKMGLPVDLRPGKEALKPVRDQIMRQLPVTHQRASPGLHAINNILDGPDFAPASQVDMDLGTIKGIARGADLPELRDLGQGLASKAVSTLEEAVQTAVAKARKTGKAPASAPNALAGVAAPPAAAPVAAASNALAGTGAAAAPGPVAVPAPKGPYQLPANLQGVAAGKEAAQLLRNGRDATIAKYDAADVLRSLPKSGAEGRQVFDQAIWSKDAGIQNIKKLAAIAPEALPKLGRAYLEDLFATATAEGGFGKTQTLWSKWQNLGPQTKQLLFRNPQLIKDLDNFFLLAKKAAENPNPSGSAVVGSIVAGTGWVLAHPLSGVPVVLGAGALSKMLHSPAGVRALTEGLKLPAGAVAARSAAAARILKAAAAVGAKPAALPMAAGNFPSSQNEKSPLLAQR